MDSLRKTLFFRIRAKNFPRGWSFVQGARFFPILVGVPLTGYLNVHSGNKKSGFYLSFIFVILGGVILFFMDFWKSRKHSHHRNQYCEIREMNANTKFGHENMIEHENLSQKLSDVHNSVVGINSVILSEAESIKDAETLNQNNNNKEVTFSPLTPVLEDEDDDDGHSYHFRGKPELLACISEENLLEQLEIEYLGDITSCNKVENYLMYSEYEGHYCDEDSFNSSNLHSEQITAPLHNKKIAKRSTVNHSFSEPDLLRLFNRWDFFYDVAKYVVLDVLICKA